MPWGTDRSDPVQILKITPVFPGAITENELIRLTRTTPATMPVSTLLVILANCSGESRTVFMAFLFARGVGRELNHIDDLGKRHATNECTFTSSPEWAAC